MPFFVVGYDTHTVVPETGNGRTPDVNAATTVPA
jgi:hypothetical protein